MEDALNLLGQVTSGRATLDAIINDAKTSLLITAPWHGAVTDNPHLQKLIQDIVGHCTSYIRAIETSIETAKTGCGLSDDVVILCDALLNNTIDEADVEDHLVGMRRNAEKAVKDSASTKDRFSEVQDGLIKVTRMIPKEALSVEAGDEETPIIQLLGNNDSPLSAEQPMDIGAAMNNLGLAAVRVAQLARDIDAFENWWARMHTYIVNAAEKSSLLTPEKRNRMIIKALLERWTVIRNDYEDYKVKIAKLRDYYPPGIKASLQND